MKKLLLFLTTCFSLTMSASFAISCHTSNSKDDEEIVDSTGTDQSDASDSQSDSDPGASESKIPITFSLNDLLARVSFWNHNGSGYTSIDHFLSEGFSIEAESTISEGRYSNGDNAHFHVRIEDGYELKSGPLSFYKEVTGLKNLAIIDNETLNSQISFSGQNGLGVTEIVQDFKLRYTLEKDYENDGELRNGDQAVFSIVPSSDYIIPGNNKFQKNISGLIADQVILNRSEKELKSTISVEGVNGKGVVSVNNQLIDKITITANDESQMFDVSNGDNIIFHVEPRRGCLLGSDTPNAFVYSVSGLPNEIVKTKQELESQISISGSNGNASAVFLNDSEVTKYKFKMVYGSAVNLKNGDIIVYDILPNEGYVLSPSTPDQIFIKINNLN